MQEGRDVYYDDFVKSQSAECETVMLDPEDRLFILYTSAKMAVEKSIASSSLAEVVDRILDKGIVIDAYVRVSLVGIELLAIEARVVVAGVDTYLKYAEAVGLTAGAAATA
jgi:hypothetical protein